MEKKPMQENLNCPICINQYSGACVRIKSSLDYYWYDCQVCGRFRLTHAADLSLRKRDKISLPKRALLSHRIRSATDCDVNVTIDSAYIEDLLIQESYISPSTQASNIIQFIGNYLLAFGEKLDILPSNFYAIIGSLNPTMAGELALELKEQGLVQGIESSPIRSSSNLLNVSLTLAGWDRYEAEKRRGTTSNYGFLALKFSDPDLDPFSREHIKPCIKAELNYDIIDMRDIAKAGIIDNIMRAQIRDSAFVLADLTHDNFGAYWEAGYAEGLGKPVIYLCERAKFEQTKTHFDTNHSTTILWSITEPEAFKKELIATLRRSLNLFPG